LVSSDSTDTISPIVFALASSAGCGLRSPAEWLDPGVQVDDGLGHVLLRARASLLGAELATASSVAE
jgi:hypothetical protein